MSQVLGLENQMAPRLRVLSQCLHGAEGRIEEAERLVAAGQTEAAKELLVALSETYPTDGRVWNNLGVVLWQQGAAPNAVRAFLKALEIDPTDRTTILNCANVFQAFGQTSDARLLLRGHLARHPSDAEARALCEAA